MNGEMISPNLTFEEFKEYADRQPSLDGNWIYRLEHIEMVEDAVMYPEFETCSNEYYFHTFKDAENFIREIISDKTNAYADTYAFVITQLPAGWTCWCNRGASWLYDHKGKLVDCCITTCEDDPYKSAFFGRSAERMRFKKGDLVEVITRDSVNLAVVADEGPSVEWFWRLYNRTKDDRGGYFADESDDCYYIIDGPGFAYHSHVSPVALMKPRYEIPNDVKAFFEHCLEVSDQENSTDKYTIAQGFIDSIQDMSAATIEIRFDKDNNRYRLVKIVKDNITRTTSTLPISADEIEPLTKWLCEVLYGKSRLWYIVRDWNENYRDSDEPELWLDTPIDELID